MKMFTNLLDFYIHNKNVMKDFGWGTTRLPSKRIELLVLVTLFFYQSNANRARSTQNGNKSYIGSIYSD